MVFGVWIGVLFAAGPANLDSANSSYASGRYAESAEQFAALLDAGHTSGDVYYNLGNALYRDGRIGHAVLAWENALDLNPRDSDASANIEIALRGAGEDPERGFSRSGPLFLNQTLSIREQSILAALLFFALGILALAARRREMAWGIPSVMLGVPGSYLLISLAWSQNQPTIGVVLAADTSLRSALGTDRGVELQKLGWGSSVRILEEAEEHLLVELPGGESGWVGIRQVAPIDAAAQFPL
ncbi:MAG: tetratricopeptide repeat protein [Myxococcota bacterium]|nr:tetratricopeptide repeat protein [Myxococcota bacterium]